MRYRLTAMVAALALGCGGIGGSADLLAELEVAGGADDEYVAVDQANEMIVSGCEEAPAPPAGWSYAESPDGTLPGDRFPSLEFEDCDGQSVSIPELLAGSELTLISLAAGWCLPCKAESEALMSDLHGPYCGSGLRIVQVLFQDPTGLPATKFFCQQWRDQYGLTIPVLVDPLFLTEELLGDGETPLNLLINSAGTILFRQEGYSPEELHTAIEMNLP